MNNKASVYLSNGLSTQLSDINEYNVFGWNGTMSGVGSPHIHIGILMKDYTTQGSAVSVTGKEYDVVGRITIKGQYDDYERVGSVG